MATAALLHCEGDVASVVHFTGGPHVGEHRDTPKMLACIKGKINDDTCNAIAQISAMGCPMRCVASAAEENFQAFCQCGNHSSCDESHPQTRAALLKDFKWSFVILFDERMEHFMLNSHFTPQGMVNLDHPHKKARPVSDSSFRVFLWCFAIDDWTSKLTEPKLQFPGSFEQHLIWLCDMRITYPREEICPGDDDAVGAFRQPKYHPNLAAMHASKVGGCICCNTGLTFGDTASLPDWEPFANG